MALSREDIRSRARPVVERPCAALGGPVHFTSLSALEWKARIDEAQRRSGEEDVEAFLDFQAALIAETLVGEDGGRVFTDAGEVRASCSQAVVLALWNAAVSAQQGDLEAEKNGSAPTPSSAA